MVSFSLCGEGNKVELGHSPPLEGRGKNETPRTKNYGIIADNQLKRQDFLCFGHAV